MKRALGFVMTVLVMALATPGAAQAQCTSYPTLCNLPVQSTTEQADLDVAIDVVLVGDGFTDMTAWHSTAAAAITRFKSQPATGIYQPTLFNFHVVDVVSATTNVSNTDTTDTALGGTTATLLSANMSKANVAALNAPDVDVVVVILNGSGRANANYPSALASGGAMRLSTDPNPISHEMGHALFQLADEYVEAGACTNPSEATLVRNRNVTATAGCAKFSTTPGAGCEVGGVYCAAGVYRSAAGCLMRSSGNVTPCPVCQQSIAQMLLEKRTGADVSEPWAVITNPTNGATVGGTVNLAAPSFDDFMTPVRVSFAVDGVYVGSAVTPQSSVPFDVGRLSNGSHTLAVYMEDTFGHARHGLDTTFTTNNALTGANLTVALNSPANNSTHNNNVFVNGTVTGGAAVWSALLVDGVVVMVSGPGAGIGFNWDGAAAADGAHTLQLQAANDLGTVFSSAVVNITLTHNAGGGPGGGSSGQLEGSAFVGIMAPAQWDTVTNLTLVRVSTFGFARPTTLTLKLDGVAVVPTPLPMLTDPGSGEASAFVDTSGWTAGPHFLEVTADDGAQANTSMAVPVVKAPLGAPEVFIRATPPGPYVRDTVTLNVAALVAAGTPNTRVLLDGTQLFTLNTAQGSFQWDTTTVPSASHALTPITVDGNGATGVGDLLYLQVDNTAPTVNITRPANGAVVPAGLVVIQDATADVGSYVLRRELYVDGVLTRTAQYETFFAVLSAGSHTLRVRAYDAVGHQTDSAVVTITVGNCPAVSCDDGNSCTVDTCQPSGLCTHVRTANCCVTPADCADTDPCTTNTCNAGTCSAAFLPGCCNYGFACNDANTTTMDLCSGEGGTCTNPPYPACANAAQCNDGDTCTVDTCESGGQCSHLRTPGCCTTTADCDDGRSCTVDACGGGMCSHTPTANCCDTAADCDDGVLCTLDQCLGQQCVHAPNTNCCVTASDCVSNNPCITMTCNANNQCAGSATPNCCTFDFQCDDRNACTGDTCSNAQCGHAPNGTCCVTVADCTAGNACTTASCDAMGRCQYAPVANCCLQDQDCADADVCTQDTCVNNACTHAAIPSCCHNAAECPNTNPCLTMACQGNVCVGSAVPGCCNTAGDCNDGNVCTTDACTSNNCSFGAVPGCCNVDPDCADADACTLDTCVNNACVHAPVTACCTTAAQCDDGNGCTTDNCVNNACTSTAVQGCCLTAADCDDGDVCTADACTSGVCQRTEVTGCCTTAAQCADQNACTADTCENNQCAHAAVANCCNVDPDCDDGDTCTVDTCVQSVCAHQGTPGCGNDGGVVAMDGGSVTVDAAVPTQDAGVRDAGGSTGDAGNRVDAGGGGRDGSASGGDAAVGGGEDAGTVVNPPGEDPPADGWLKGCVCVAPARSPGWMMVVLLVLAARRRQRR